MAAEFTAWIGLGSNLLDRAAMLRSAVAALSQLGRIAAVSSIWETAPVGIEDQPRFLNAALVLHTALSPHELLPESMRIERAHGRDRHRSDNSIAWGPRTLDLDLLLMECDGKPIVLQTPQLTLPHPAMHDRRFVLAPLAEIGPQVRHPLLDRSIAQLLEMLPAQGPNHANAVVQTGRTIEDTY